jgi:hypothetical protein
LSNALNKKKPSWFIREGFVFILLVRYYSDCADPSRFNSSTRRPLIRIIPRTRVCRVFFIFNVSLNQKGPSRLRRAFVISFSTCKQPFSARNHEEANEEDVN